MKLIKMEYKGYEFEINPTSIKIIHSKKIANQSVLNSFSKTSFVSVEPITVSGKGIICGNKQYEKANELERIFRDNKSSYLFIPGFKPIKSFFSELVMSSDSKTNCINYSFEFVEDYQGKKDNYNFGYTIAKKGENMFDIANRLDVRIESLVDKNNFEDLFSIKEGDRVYYD